MRFKNEGTIMAKDTKPLEEWNANAQRTLEQTMEHTRGVLGQYFKFLEQTLSSYPSGGTEFGEKLKSYAEKNIATAHEYVNKLSQAKDLQDIVRIQTEFMQVQLNAFGEQTKSLGEAFTKAATDAVKKPFGTS
jgi:hypothetical protein